MTEAASPPTPDRLQAAKAVASDPKWLFEELTRRIRTSPRSDCQLRITAHIREKTGHSTIVSFHNNGATKEQKVEVYQECIKAIITNDFNPLLGTIPAGQAPVPKAAPEPEPEKPEADPAILKPTPRSESPAAPSMSAPPRSTTPVGSKADILKMIGEMLENSGSVDPDEVASIARDIVASEMKILNKEVNARLEEGIKNTANGLKIAVDAYLAKVPPKDVIELRKWDGTVKEITGLRHKQLPLVIKATTARTVSGWPVPAWWYGAPGAGKTHLWRQVSEALGVKYYPIPLGPTSTEGKLLGYKNLATGDFVQGCLYLPYKEGGLVNLDEIDVCDPSVLVGANSISSNEEFMFPNGEVVKRHRDFYLVASANTLGTGATGGFTRNKLDAATLDRFAKFKLEYDADLESNLCGNPKWAAYVWKVREYVEKNCSQTTYITPRASINGAALLAAGLTPTEVMDATLFAMMSKDMKATVIKAVGQYQP